MPIDLAVFLFNVSLHPLLQESVTPKSGNISDETSDLPVLPTGSSPFHPPPEGVPKVWRLFRNFRTSHTDLTWTRKRRRGPRLALAKAPLRQLSNCRTQIGTIPRFDSDIWRCLPCAQLLLLCYKRTTWQNTISVCIGKQYSHHFVWNYINAFLLCQT